MRIVLRQDVDHLGERGQIVNVSPGFARNFLVPKGLALEATPGNLRSIELQKKVWGARLTTVFPRQGHYARTPEAARYPPADVTIDRIDQLAQLDLPALLAAAERPRP